MHSMTQGTPDDSREAFARIYQSNEWGSAESRSGLGSAYATTHRVRTVLPMLLRALDVKSMLDAPCGDFNWMRFVDLGKMHYIGCDIVPEVIETNRVRYADREFHVLDLAVEPLPNVDLIFSRDCLQHLTEPDIWRALRNFKKCGARWLFTSSHSTSAQDIARETGGFGFLNLQQPPFSLPLPLLIMPEEHYASKAMCLWDMAQIGA
ncbi:mll0579 [Mesorhizobium japonicum MAFF 303099]|uniref:Mll0579 protein n=1 Tax=Mesorhizobium japonicum (strain LMG 29417 / CECT 9101 / MAFF 303099) TaxID=266835 RepID=Q98MH4_RHILO|nr:mll0579 [Mesorhizobium japonicum MAFF 303099]